LAVVLGVLRQHHGVLAFESAPGAGTTFRIWLPTTEPTGASDRSAPR
jgi:signal transduction histidine kinase